MEPRGELHLCRDPRDDVVLETALLGRANYAVSRDDDLKRDLELMQKMQQREVRVVSVSQFLSFLEKAAPRKEKGIRFFLRYWNRQLEPAPRYYPWLNSLATSTLRPTT